MLRFLDRSAARSSGGTAPRRAWLAIATVLLGAFLLAGAACDSSATTSIAPITGILVRSETLTTGHGCGRGPTQLFKYAVVVFAYDGAGAPTDRASYQRALTANVFDCYSDGAFVSLPSTGGNTTFRLEIYVYNEASYLASRDAIETAGTNIVALRATTPPPTFTTECIATQQEDVQALAVCDPLGPGLSGFGGAVAKTQITLATTSFRLADGRTATCVPGGDAGTDAQTDGLDADAAAAEPDGDAALPADAASDGEAGAAADASAPVPFASVRIRPRTGGTVTGPVVDQPCGTPYLAEVAAEPTTYALDVGLVDTAGQPLAETVVCTVTSQTGATSSAVCP